MVLSDGDEWIIPERISNVMMTKFVSGLRLSLWVIPRQCLRACVLPYIVKNQRFCVFALTGSTVLVLC